MRKVARTGERKMKGTSMIISGFSHVTINIGDVAAALHFYVDILGRRLAHRGEHDVYLERGVAWLRIRNAVGL